MACCRFLGSQHQVVLGAIQASGIRLDGSNRAFVSLNVSQRTPKARRLPGLNWLRATASPTTATTGRIEPPGQAGLSNGDAGWRARAAESVAGAGEEGCGKGNMDRAGWVEGEQHSLQTVNRGVAGEAAAQLSVTDLVEEEGCLGNRDARGTAGSSRHGQQPMQRGRFH